ncbi:hypothetical protein KFL_004700070 [Klebsormidium nitens]|uniref:Dynein assembly factor 1, axonemal homolog n=1 Tax=Klebsormidium nitens TaxID=105231 RepID=A0A1Y1ID87_KLENI|nr:hypothetical protein KFL_004700070 [Klebsormidium nitens]|eukprot:GAQ88925.1 hypothetical protein KFL_004700070 [Klebsormidium nitens]
MEGSPMELTKEWLRKFCREQKLYTTPYLNDKLYLHFKGFERIQNLEEYTGLRSLFLEGNGIDSLAGLEALRELRCLYVQQNCIERIDHLENLIELDTINISNNSVRVLENLSCLPKLQTLIASKNRFDSAEGIAHLKECPSISVLDLSENKLEDGQGVLDVLKAMPKLRCVYLKGNPMVSKLPNYRKALIASLPNLKYLDDRPVFDADRACAEAWARDGLQGEREARARLREEERSREERNFRAMKQWRSQSFAERRVSMGLPPLEDEESGSGDDMETEREPPELIRARETLAHYPARLGEEEPPELTNARAAVRASDSPTSVAMEGAKATGFGGEASEQNSGRTSPEPGIRSEMATEPEAQIDLSPGGATGADMVVEEARLGPGSLDERADVPDEEASGTEQASEGDRASEWLDEGEDAFGPFVGTAGHIEGMEVASFVALDEDELDLNDLD